MRILDAGHKFLLSGLDNAAEQLLVFVKRDEPQEKYPDNSGHYAGTQVQEVIRVLVSRLMYVNTQYPCEETELAILRLQEAFRWLEIRAARIHNRRDLSHTSISILFNLPPCSLCGHIDCNETCKK